ncbi:MAG TPA: alpha/beta hydrolase, partial [Humisphaera sp.]|nr:alpha/beta hydrolase [Humisphaera sp.]
MNKLSVLLVMVLTALIAGNAWAKRVAPKPVTPVVHSGVQYAAPNEDGIEGQIEARNPKTGEKLWDVVIYKNKVKPNLEEDIQWVFITELAIRGDTLRVTNERGEIFTLDLTTRKVLAADPQIRRDVAYAEPKNERQMLDVYSPAEGKNHPVVVWIHGGGWRAGSKAGMQNKPQTFVDKGFVFVSTTYRFLPNVTVKQMTGDIAKAIRWVHEHAKEFGGDPDTIFVMGHSAGAHLAALVCTDDSYLKAEGLSLSIIRGCVPVDVSVYDIPKRLKDGGSVSPAALTAIFGETEELQRDLSPAAHVAKGKHIPPFLILYVADRA